MGGMSEAKITVTTLPVSRGPVNPGLTGAAAGVPLVTLLKCVLETV